MCNRLLKTYPHTKDVNSPRVDVPLVDYQFKIHLTKMLHFVHIVQKNKEMKKI